MRSSSLDTTPRTPASPAVRGVVSNADRSPLGFGMLLARAGSSGYFQWLDHVRSAAGCTRPVRLSGDLLTVNAATGVILETRHTSDLPDAAIYKACGTRRATLCPSCARTYQADAYQLIRAGLIGGKGVPTSVAGHDFMFATFTAPSFGPVHTRHVRTHVCGNRRHCSCRPEPCHPRRDAPTCPHGVELACWQRHDDGATQLGTPLCLDCYDHNHHVVWNHHASALWSRTKETAERTLAKLCRRRGIPFVKVVTDSGRPRYLPPVRITHGKVAELQRRGVVHFHALLRLDGVHPDNRSLVVPPPAGISYHDLVDAVTTAATSTILRTPAHPDQPHGWPITWGTQIDLQRVTLTGDGSITDGQVAGYLSKYATKATEDTGHSSTRLTDATIDIYANEEGTHAERLVDACWHLGRPHPSGNSTGYEGLRLWAHMLGYGGHFLTKGRRYSTTFAVLRAARQHFRRAQLVDEQPDRPGPLALAPDGGEDQVLTMAVLSFAAAGWKTTGDALLANTSAAMARARAQTGRDEIAHQIGTALNHARHTS